VAIWSGGTFAAQMGMTAVTLPEVSRDKNHDFSAARTGYFVDKSRFCAILTDSCQVR
jgi:hypothetical protein